MNQKGLIFSLVGIIIVAIVIGGYFEWSGRSVPELNNSQNNLAITDESTTTATFNGYHTKVTRSYGDETDLFQKECDVFLAYKSEDSLFQYFANGVLEGNTVNSLTSDKNLLLNVNLNDLDLNVKEKVLASTKDHPIQLSVQKLVLPGRDAMPCESFVKILSAGGVSIIDGTASSISSDKKNILIDGKVMLSVDDDVIFAWFKSDKSYLCDAGNINTAPDRKMFCTDKATFRNEVRFRSIVASPDGKKIGFTIETDTLPDTVVGIFYPSKTSSKVSILSNYYLGNEFISFSPTGVNLVYKGGCFEGNCAFFIKNSEILADQPLTFIPQYADARGNYEFVKWLSDRSIEYKLDGQSNQTFF